MKKPEAFELGMKISQDLGITFIEDTRPHSQLCVFHGADKVESTGFGGYRTGVLQEPDDDDSDSEPYTVCYNDDVLVLDYIDMKNVNLGFRLRLCQTCNNCGDGHFMELSDAFLKRFKK